jgi:hypothetical protein
MGNLPEIESSAFRRTGEPVILYYNEGTTGWDTMSEFNQESFHITIAPWEGEFNPLPTTPVFEEPNIPIPEKPSFPAHVDTKAPMNTTSGTQGNQPNDSKPIDTEAKDTSVTEEDSSTETQTEENTSVETENDTEQIIVTEESQREELKSTEHEDIITPVEENPTVLWVVLGLAVAAAIVAVVIIGIKTRKMNNKN